MVEKSNKNIGKKEMPESIKKLFEQKQNGVAKQDTKVEANTFVEEIDTLKKDKFDNKNQESEVLPVNIEHKEEQKKSKKKKKEKSNKEEKLKKDKNVKEKKIQEDDSNKNKKFSKKTKVTILSILLAIACCAFVITLTIFLVPKTNKMDPPVLQIYSLSNQTILHVEENEDAILYEFYIQKKGETNISYISSNTNEVSIKSKLSTPGEYYIWARYGGKNSKETSNDSIKLTFYYYEYLDIPSVYVSSDQQTLTWLKVVNAKEYRVYYGMQDENLNYFTVAQPASTTTNVVFEFSQFNNLNAGNYTLYVQAIADESNFYKNSELSKPILYANKTKLADVVSATFNSENNMLSFKIDTLKTVTNFYEIVINDNETFICKIDSILENNIFDLTPYLKKGETVSNLKIKALGDGYYITDSEYILAGIL